MGENPKNIPNHIAFIMDGNRRWAANHMLEVWNGHEFGAGVVEEMINEAVAMKIPYFSFWGSSLDNINKRSKREVEFLLEIFKTRFKKIAENKKIHKEGVNINILGRWRELFPADIKESMQRAIDVTKSYGNYFLNFFIAYSGIDEMENAIRNIVKETKKNPNIEITPALIKNNLFTKNLPPVDYLIRTGGDPHLSGGFMMWETADAQLFFLDKFWPDFSKEDFRAAIEEYGRRKRKFGA